jgi:hypothetical protein
MAGFVHKGTLSGTSEETINRAILKGNDFNDS